MRFMSLENIPKAFRVARIDDWIALGGDVRVGLGLGSGLGVVSDMNDKCRSRNRWLRKGVCECRRSSLIGVMSSSVLLSRSTGMSPSSNCSSTSKSASASSSSRFRGLKRLGSRSSNGLPICDLSCSSELGDSESVNLGCLSLPSNDFSACSCAHEAECCRFS